jgi:hypothetical protein
MCFAYYYVYNICVEFVFSEDGNALILVGLLIFVPTEDGLTHLLLELTVD